MDAPSHYRPDKPILSRRPWKPHPRLDAAPGFAHPSLAIGPSKVETARRSDRHVQASQQTESVFAPLCAFLLRDRGGSTLPGWFILSCLPANHVVILALHDALRSTAGMLVTKLLASKLNTRIPFPSSPRLRFQWFRRSAARQIRHLAALSVSARWQMQSAIRR